MSFEDLDNNFDKVAQTPRKTDIKRQEEREQEQVEEKVKYETTFENPGLTGLLAAFQEKLKNRDPEKADSGEFETVNLTSHSVINTTPQAAPQNEVSEEQIDSLLKNTPSEVSKELEVEETRAKLRYESTHPTIDNRPSIHDITGPTSPPTPNTSQQPYSQGQQITDDEVARQLAIHNQKKAERQAQEALESETTEPSESGETE